MRVSMEIVASAVIKQHLIDPEICIRCNVADAVNCNLCMTCIQPCPTGAIDNRRAKPRAKAHSVDAQMGWDSLAG
jgi:benzoyl-CoA 2,3-dioxygenase component A